MKKVYVVSKTHLDLGFTDYAENIYNQYLDSYIPNSINVAKSLNADGKKRFVWTTGSWLIKEALHNEKLRKPITDALKSGDIAAHAMPFTTHTELLDYDTLDYGLSIIDEIDAITGRKTISAKMTDVPAHTIGLVPALHKYGIKLLHIGVNGASALVNVPPCFLWKCGESEVVVIYSGDYGGAYKSEYLDDILYFNHTLDNRGAGSLEKEKARYKHIESKFPDYEVVGACLDDYAVKLWEVKDKLPILTDELGDTWIHGVATDPYKVGAVRELIALKNKWLADGSLIKGSDEYINLADNILCIAEHTWGMDMKKFFADYENYLRKDFDKARIKDTVVMRHLFRDFPQNFIIFTSRFFGSHKRGSYSAIEKSWQEQREYINKAISKLSDIHKSEAITAVEQLIPNSLPNIPPAEFKPNKEYAFADNLIVINELGGLKKLVLNGKNCINSNDKSPVEYVSYGKADYDYWLTHYTRNLESTRHWSVGDFARPLIKYVDGKFKTGRFIYKMIDGGIKQNKDELVIAVKLTIDDYCYTNLGSPKNVLIKYCLNKENLSVKVYWTDKPSSRLTESLNFRLFPQGKDIQFSKIGTTIKPYSIRENGNRKLSCVEDIKLNLGDKNLKIINKHSPLVGLGEVNILHFDNEYGDLEKDGLSYILQNNVWGTNFPLWYNDNAYFEFILKVD